MESLPRTLAEPVVRAALAEDLGRMGDLIASAIVDSETEARVRLVAREDGVLAGTDCVQLAWELLDPRTVVSDLLPDGSRVRAGTVIGTARGPARALLRGERAALNFLSHLSGVATATAAVAEAIAHTPAVVTDTCKNMPGLRALQQHAVRAGGGNSKLFGLDDALLIKDNHIAAAGGIAPAVARIRAQLPQPCVIKVEVDSLEQLAEVMALKLDAVLLDNMDLETLRRAVAIVDQTMITEASGRITAATAVPIAEAGVNLISVGWLTHSAPALDIGLDYAEV